MLLFPTRHMAPQRIPFFSGAVSLPFQCWFFPLQDINEDKGSSNRIQANDRTLIFVCEFIKDKYLFIKSYYYFTHGTSCFHIYVLEVAAH